jgi:3-hydroxyacyl-CoA dehydrogenase
LENAIGTIRVQEQLRTALAQGAGCGTLAGMGTGIAHVATQPGLAINMIDMEAEALRPILA